MNLQDINTWFLFIALVSLIYLCIKAWHVRFASFRQDECHLCDSKKFRRIRREKILRLLPFGSKKYYCKECRKEYLILTIFKKQFTITN